MILHKEKKNGFQYLEVTNNHASAKIALQGAHIFAYKAKNKPVLLWLSSKAYFTEGKAIRGGIPLCFPWFGKHREDATLPQHGFARTSLWKVVYEEEREDGTTQVRLKLTETPESLKVWPYHFEVNVDVLIGKSLSLMLHITNTDKQAFEVSAALHTYLNVSNIEHISIEGLEDTKYYDELTHRTDTQLGSVVINEEIDRVYQTKKKNITLHDADAQTEIHSKGSSSLVVWNPYIEKSHAMADMSDSGYETMVCLETANAREDTRLIEAGETHSLGVVYRQN